MEELKNIFMSVVKDNYFNREGRARRREFWMFQLAMVIIGVAIGIVVGIFSAISDTLGMIIYGIFAIAMLGLLLPSIALGVRRLHDIGKSGWYYFVCLIPLVGSFILLYFFVTEGTKGDNEYGPDPKA